MPTLVSAAGGDVAKMGKGFAGIDGISQWDALTAGATPGGSSAGAAAQEATGAADGHPTPSRSAPAAAPRTELLHNIDGINGSGEAALRVGDFKLLRSPTGTDVWCDTCLKKEGCIGAGKPAHPPTPYGGVICCEDPVVGGDCTLTAALC